MNRASAEEIFGTLPEGVNLLYFAPTHEEGIIKPKRRRRRK